MANDEALPVDLEASPGAPEAALLEPTGRAARAPLRRCIATGAERDKSAMIRFVLAPAGEDGAPRRVLADVAGALPGRGAWVDASRAAIEAAQKRQAFSKAFRQKTDSASSLADQIEALLETRALHSLGLARKAGQALSGFDVALDFIGRKRPLAIIAAADSAADGREALYRAAQGRYGDIYRIGMFSAAALGMALGRASVVHVCLSDGGAARAFVALSQKLAGFRPIIPPAWMEEQK